jgi:alpha-L-rhamnosidase
VLYDTVDVLQLLRPGKNVLGLMLGQGWLEPRGESSFLAPRQLIALLSVTAVDGTMSKFYSSVAASASPSALTFQATAGPHLAVDMYRGEDYDGRVAAALAGWSTPGYNPIAAQADSATVPLPSPDSRPVWVPATAPAVGPASWGSLLSAHHRANIVRTHEVFTPVNISEPAAGKFVFDFGQNMAGQVTLRVASCPAGTVISMQHTEVLGRNGRVRNSFCLRPKYHPRNIIIRTGILN